VTAASEYLPAEDDSDDEQLPPVVPAAGPMRLQLRVYYTEESRLDTVDVSVGQREMAKWEQQPFGCSAGAAMDLKPFSFLRWVAWERMRTTRQLPRNSRDKSLTFAEWDELVDEVIDNEADEPADPTPPAAARAR
jgi:hypothetical protein